MTNKVTKLVRAEAVAATMAERSSVEQELVRLTGELDELVKSFSTKITGINILMLSQREKLELLDDAIGRLMIGSVDETV